MGIVSVWLLLSFKTPTVLSQAVYGSIFGTVTDANGGAVLGAKVTVTSVTKGTTNEITTNENGNYTVTHLIPDLYNVKIEGTGFKIFEVKNIQVSADSSVRQDAQLQVGDITQSVEVSGEIEQLKTDRADVATEFTTLQVESLPIYNRNFTTFQLLSPGNQRMNGWNHAASENPQGSQQIMTQGQHFSGTAFELDGTDNQDPILGIIVINPNLEAVQEVKVTSQNYDAEFGKAIGALVTTQTKSGTNELHGSVFDFERSNSNFARNPFTQGPSKGGVPSGNWNQFGGTLGGPIRKDKIFFFGDYQGQRSHIGGSGSERIPTAAERSGDLSDLGVPIFDPCTTTGGVFVPACNVPPATRAEFPGGVIPASRLSPQAQALLNFIPVGASGTGLNPNFFGSGTNVLDSDGFDTRSDYVATEKMHVFGRYSLQQFTRSGPGLFGTLAGGKAIPSDPSVGDFAGSSKVRNQSLATGFDYTFSPTWLMDFRFGYTRYRVNVLPGGLGTSPAKDAGIPGLNLDNFFTSGMPYFASRFPGNGLFAFGYALGADSEGHCNCPLTENEHQYQFVTNWTHIIGNHQVKVGADLRHAYNLRIPSDAHRAGELVFNNDVTEGPGGGGGVGLAGFLIGTASTFNRYVSTSTNAYETQPRLFFYGKDTWRITSKLTFDYGLRWEIYVPESASGTGKGGWVDLSTGEVRVAGQQGIDLKGNTSTNYKHFAPRIGIAYQFDPKTVVRLGYGRSYDIGVFGSIFGHAITQNLPVLGKQSLSPGSGNEAFTLNQGPPSFDPATALTVNNCNGITDPTKTKTECLGPNGRALLPDNVGGKVRPFNNRIASVDAWNASVQRQVTPTIAATLAYVGNKGTHTFVGDNPSYNVNGPTVIGYLPGCTSFAAGSATIPDPATCPNGALPQSLRKPFYSKYGWTQGFDYYGMDSDSNYNSLQATVEKRFANGLTFQSSYTFQHANTYWPDYFNIDKKVGYGPSSDYRNHVFILTEVYLLPFGRGRHWGANMGRAADFLIGGWSINSATNFSSGLPFTPTLSSCTASVDTNPCRPDRVGAVKDGTRSGDPTATGYWFQTTPINPATGKPTLLSSAGQTAGPWAQAAVDTFGNVGRNSLRGPKFFDTDLAVFKDFSITERTRAQFQFQFFNIFNHRNLALPTDTGNGNCVDCSNAGSINNIAYGSQMRAIQFGLKLSF